MIGVINRKRELTGFAPINSLSLFALHLDFRASLKSSRFILHFQNGPRPMQLVVPRAVSAAEMMLAMI